MRSLYNDPLQALIEKNNLKLEQHQHRMMFRLPQTPQVRESHQNSHIFSKSTNKSSSIDKSYFSCVQTRKSTKQSFFLPKSVATSQYLDTQPYILYQGDESLTPINQDNSSPKNKMIIDDNQETQASMQSTLVGQLKKEKDILIQQHQYLVTQLSREIESNKRQAIKNEQLLQQQIRKLEDELNLYKQCQNKVLDLEQNLQQLIMENNELQTKLQDQNKWLYELQEQFDVFSLKMQEVKSKIQETKLFSNQLTQITQYLLNKQTPPLDFLVYMNNQSKQLQHDQQQEFILKQRKQQIKQQHFNQNAFPITKETFAQLFQIQIENTLVINQIVKDLRNNVDRFSQQYIAEVGLHLM